MCITELALTPTSIGAKYVMMYVLAHSGESDVKGRGGWVSKFSSARLQSVRRPGAAGRKLRRSAAPGLRPGAAGTGPMHAMPLPASAGPCHAQTGILC